MSDSRVSAAPLYASSDAVAAIPIRTTCQLANTVSSTGATWLVVHPPGPAPPPGRGGRTKNMEQPFPSSVRHSSSAVLFTHSILPAIGRSTQGRATRTVTFAADAVVLSIRP